MSIFLLGRSSIPKKEGIYLNWNVICNMENDDDIIKNKYFLYILSLFHLFKKQKKTYGFYGNIIFLNLQKILKFKISNIN